MDRLWRRNLLAACLHFFNGAAGIVMIASVQNIQDFKFGLTTMFIDWEGDPVY